MTLGRCGPRFGSLLDRKLDGDLVACLEICEAKIRTKPRWLEISRAADGRPQHVVVRAHNSLCFHAVGQAFRVLRAQIKIRDQVWRNSRVGGPRELDEGSLISRHSYPREYVGMFLSGMLELTIGQ